MTPSSWWWVVGFLAGTGCEDGAGGVGEGEVLTGATGAAGGEGDGGPASRWRRCVKHGTLQVKLGNEGVDKIGSTCARKRDLIPCAVLSSTRRIQHSSKKSLEGENSRTAVH